nr:hypothetical protein [Acidisarcina polymorpha]
MVCLASPGLGVAATFWINARWALRISGPLARNSKATPDSGRTSITRAAVVKESPSTERQSRTAALRSRAGTAEPMAM